MIRRKIALRLARVYFNRRIFQGKIQPARPPVGHPALKEDLLGGLGLSLQRVGQRRLVGYRHLGQQVSRRRNFVAGLWDGHGAQSATAAVEGADQFDTGRQTKPRLFVTLRRVMGKVEMS